MIKVRSPIDGTPIGEVPSLTLDDALGRLGRARRAQESWGRSTHEDRGRVMRRFVDGIRSRQKEIADLLVLESGKTSFEAYVFEIATTIHLTDYFLRNVDRILEPRKIPISVFRNRSSYVHYKPRGVVFVIAPWNFPLSNSMGQVMMALIAGNAALLKPASLTPMTAMRVKDIADEAGLDADLFQVLTGSGRLASDLIERGGVDYVSFTGSTETGRKVAELCGRKLIPCTMELGGKAPALVLDDADIGKAARSVVWGAFAHSGQICASIERALVDDKICDEFTTSAVELVRSLRQGDPRTGEVDVGSMTDPHQIEIVEAHVRDALERGAKVITGGKRSSAGPNFYEPTILTDVTEEMRVMREESFGPILPILRVKGESEMIRIANSTPYGLLASVYTKDSDRGRRVAEQVRAGTVIVNDALLTHAFPETPWHGIRDSGFGRVHSDEGLRDLCLTLHVNTDAIGMDNPAWYPYSTAKRDRILSLLDLSVAGLPLGEKVRALGDLVRGKRGWV